MAQPVILVVFACHSGNIEKLALSAAVGAVQARAMIRLRRLPESNAGDSNEALVRMRKEYVGPAEADVLGADALILAASDETNDSSAQWQPFLSLLRRLASEGKLSKKVGAAIGGLADALTRLGVVTVISPSNDPLLLGRNVAEKARSLKS